MKLHGWYLQENNRTCTMAKMRMSIYFKLPLPVRHILLLFGIQQLTMIYQAKINSDLKVI
jgi:hypothetical protein